MKNAFLIIVSVLALSVSQTASAATAGNGTALRGGELIVERPTLTCLGFEWRIDGDADGDATARVQVRHVYPPDWKGPKEKPAYENIMHAVNGFRPICDCYQTVHPNVAKPGTLIKMHAGVHTYDNHKYWDFETKLAGTVEVDETYIGGKRSGKDGRGAKEKTLVVVAAQEDGEQIGRIRLCRVADASRDSLGPAVQKAVECGSTVRTDGWSGYGNLTELGYVHDIVRASAEVGENVLPLANRVISLLKRWLLGTHQGAVRPSHLDYYLDEFTFRFNRRTSRSRGKLFYRLVQQAAAVQPVLGREIEGSRPDV
mgnify:CR=1 FL=1